MYECVYHNIPTILYRNLRLYTCNLCMSVYLIDIIITPETTAKIVNRFNYSNTTSVLMYFCLSY